MKFADATAPAVIDEELCRDCIHLLQTKEQGVEQESYRHSAATKKDNIEFGEVQCLMFSFKNILKINNLEGFEKLVKLYLDNNVIVQIENLDHLVNLEWLDLSFNNIEHISGLNKLTKLENLSLFNNHIEAIEGLDAQVDSLEVLSVGNNRIADLEQTKVLRKFHKLQAVTFAGNPMAGKDDYRAYVLAHLRHLRFLDYRLVDEAEVQQAESDGALQEKLQEIRLVEQQEEEAREAERKLADRAARLAALHMGALDNFWGKMEEATREFTSKVGVVEQLSELHSKQRPKFEAKVEEFVQANEGASVAKEAELKEYLEAATAMKEDNNAEAFAYMSKFDAKAKEAKRAFAKALGASSGRGQSVDPDLMQHLDDLRAANDHLYEELMELEMMQVDQFIAALDAFERNYTNMHQATLDRVASTFNETRELASAWHDEAKELAALRHDEFVEHNLNDSDDLSDEVKVVLNDKEGMTNALEQANEARISFLDSIEDAVAKAERAAYDGVVNGLRKGEHNRNRDRINEIAQLVHTVNKKIIDDLDTSIDQDDI
mmetsp:Transcript_5108/g.15105  ORF Transcript_5108/g.15105 Transcript_5108/m.15105 type:complete len:547 (-) Transcript_5108:357-1997(-)